MGIISHTKKFKGTNCYFEQRATNEEQQEIYYFNQLVKKFPVIDDNILKVKKIVENMHTAMKNCGIGLAHNQYPKEEGVSNPYAIFIIESEKDKVSFEAFINPVIVGFTKEKAGFYHGCLSVIGANRAEVATYQDVLIASYNEDLKLQVKKYSNFASIICQHEFNHLATRGTYVDTVNTHINGDRFKDAEEFYLDEEEIDKLNEMRSILNNVGNEVACLINEEVLSRCKKAVQEDALYMKAVNEYLIIHTEDISLHENLMSVSDTDLSLYTN